MSARSASAIGWRVVFARLALLMLAAMGLARTASAESLPHLAVARSDQALDCPDAVALAASVAKLLGRSALRTEGEPVGDSIRVAFERGDKGYGAAVTVTGSSPGRRELEDPGPRCAGLAAALEVTLALLLDPEFFTRAVPSPPVETKGPAAAAPTASVSPAAPPTRPEHPAEPARRYAVMAGAGVIAGSSPAVAVALRVDGTVAVRRNASIGAGAMWTSPSAQWTPTGDVRVQLLAAIFRACGSIGETTSAFAAACLLGAAGDLRASAPAYAREEPQSRLWLAGGAGAVAGVAVARRFGVLLGAEAFVPLREHRVIIEGRDPPTAYQTSPVTGVVYSSCRFAF